ncbi:MAG: hypothetical protein M3O82_00795, partial [Verrucomicrobiota bacterium]|nr:hypothetical protein [Verrucomicrobiota bacterium]
GKDGWQGDQRWARARFLLSERRPGQPRALRSEAARPLTAAIAQPLLRYGRNHTQGIAHHVQRTLKTRAARNKRSLNQDVIAVVEETVAPARRVDVEAMLADAKRFRASVKFKTRPSEIDAFKREGRE